MPTNVFPLILAIAIAPHTPMRADDNAQTPSSVRVVADHDKSGQHRIRLSGLPAALLDEIREDGGRSDQLATLLAVYVDSDEAADTPVLGRYSVEDSELVFRPRFAFRPGLRYRVRYHLEMTTGTVAGTETFVFAPVRPSAAVEIAAVYPTSCRLPENLLKFYIHFSGPMGQGEAYRHISLIRSNGEPVDDPWLKLGEELWDTTGTRFTLFIDPGRIKRGLKPRDDLGPVLESGQSYTLIIRRDWRDADNRPLRNDYRRTFYVVAPDTTSPDVATWRLTSPEAGSDEPLMVAFPEPLDHAMLHRVLAVETIGGSHVAGTPHVVDRERKWHWRPKRPWNPGRYRLVVATTLEDLAGNSPGRRFEVPLAERRPETRAAALTVSVPFAIVPSADRQATDSQQ